MLPPARLPAEPPAAWAVAALTVAVVLLVPLAIAWAHAAPAVPPIDSLLHWTARGRAAAREAVRALLGRPPLVVGLAAAVLLFVGFCFRAFDPLSPNTDDGGRGISFPGYDFFGFPRCGLALRYGTNPFTAADDYWWYGPWATAWVTQPSACLLAVPLSYLSPWTAYRLFNGFNFALHLGIIAAFGLRLPMGRFRRQRRVDQVRDLVFFGAMGFFVPWYVLYHEGQYHSLAVLAAALVLLNRRHVVAGFVLSALSKPLLAPAGLTLVVRRRWGLVVRILALVALGYLPWLVLRYDPALGLSLGRNHDFDRFIANSRSHLEYSVYRWNSQVSLSAALDEIMPTARHLPIRYALAALAVGVGVVLFARRPFEVAVVACLLWYFFLYGRGHEYHLTLYVPMLLCLYVLPDGRYRGWATVAVALLVVVPTAYLLFRTLYGFPLPDGWSNEAMLAHSRPLYALFLWQRPLAAFLLLAVLLAKEWPYWPDGDGARGRRARGPADRAEPAGPIPAAPADGRPLRP
jgi:hypothetical protein